MICFRGKKVLLFLTSFAGSAEVLFSCFLHWISPWKRKTAYSKKICNIVLQNPVLKNRATVRRGARDTNLRSVNSRETRSGKSAIPLLWAASPFCPDWFQDVNLSREVFLFYCIFYRYSPGIGEIKDILQLGRIHELS